MTDPAQRTLEPIILPPEDPVGELSHLVTPEHGPRPAGRPDECFYCGRPVGAEHADACVLRRKLVFVDVTIAVGVAVPASWDRERIEAHYNEGTWCSDNILEDLAEAVPENDEAGPCSCRSMHITYRGEP